MSARRNQPEENPQPVEDGAPEATAMVGDTEVLSEELNAQRLAARLGLEFVDVMQFPIDHDLFRSIPVDMMFRYNFVPYKYRGNTLVCVVSDPSDVLMIDELELLLGHPIDIMVGTRSA